MRWFNAAANEALFQASTIGAGERVLEIGCGPGQLLERVVGAGAHAIGVDPSEPLRRMAARANAAAIAAGRAEVLDGTAGALPLSTASVEVVLAAHSFQFWPDPQAAIHEIRRVLRAGGRVGLQLRRHRPRVRQHLPNPLSRTEDEVGAARAAFERAGFACDIQRDALLVFHEAGA